MKKGYSLLFFIFVFSSVFGQVKKDSVRREKKVSIGIYFSPNDSFYKGESQVSYPTNPKPATCFNVALSINFKLNNYFQIATGASYNKLRYIDDYAFPTYPLESQRRYDFEFIGVPLLIQLNYQKPKFLLYLDVGAEFNHLIKNRVATYDSNNKLIDEYGYTQPRQPFAIPFLVGEIGIENRIYKRLYSSIGVGYKYALVPIIWNNTSNNQKANQYLYSSYLKVGFNYKF